MSGGTSIGGKGGSGTSGGVSNGMGGKRSLEGASNGLGMRGGD